MMYRDMPWRWEGVEDSKMEGCNEDCKHLGAERLRYDAVMKGQDLAWKRQRERQFQLEEENKELKEKFETARNEASEWWDESLDLSMRNNELTQKCEKLEGASLDLTERLYQAVNKCEKLKAEKERLVNEHLDSPPASIDIIFANEYQARKIRELVKENRDLMVKNENQRKELVSFNERHNKALEDVDYWKGKVFKERTSEFCDPFCSSLEWVGGHHSGHHKCHEVKLGPTKLEHKKGVPFRICLEDNPCK
jgi:chromosome segregation ATPase